MQKIIAVFVIMTAFLLGGCTSEQNDIVLEDAKEVALEQNSVYESAADEASGYDTSSKTEEEEKSIVVYVCGAVASPGVYELPAGSRVNDAVALAGGLTDDADKEHVNLAAALSDGKRLYMPAAEDYLNDNSDPFPKDPDACFDNENPALDYDSGDSDSGLININTASAEELKSIPGIGESIASKIIDYRESNGGFGSIEDIMKVPGIKDKLFSRIASYITV